MMRIRTRKLLYQTCINKSEMHHIEVMLPVRSFHTRRQSLHENLFVQSDYSVISGCSNAVAFKTGWDTLILLPLDDFHIFELDGPQEDWTGKWQEKIIRYAPTAFVCASQDALTRTYLACQITGHTIPGDFSLIGLEPEAVLPGILPDIARPTLPVTETGHRAVDRMLWRIANPPLPYEQIMLQGGLHEGTTVRKALPLA